MEAQPCFTSRHKRPSTALHSQVLEPWNHHVCKHERQHAGHNTPGPAACAPSAGERHLVPAKEASWPPALLTPLLFLVEDRLV